MRQLTLLTLAVILAACGTEEATTATEQPSSNVVTTVKPQGPVQIDYKIIGTPIVGQPVAVDLYLKSTIGEGEISIDYGISDPTAMQLPETQPERVTMTAAPVDGPSSRQQVRIIPLREGRLYLNVTAKVTTDTGSYSTAQAIPVQVGAAPSRVIEDHGELATDENGNAIKVLKSD